MIVEDNVTFDIALNTVLVSNEKYILLFSDRQYPVMSFRLPRNLHIWTMMKSATTLTRFSHVSVAVGTLCHSGTKHPLVNSIITSNFALPFIVEERRQL